MRLLGPLFTFGYQATVDYASPGSTRATPFPRSTETPESWMRQLRHSQRLRSGASTLTAASAACLASKGLHLRKAANPKGRSMPQHNRKRIRIFVFQQLLLLFFSGGLR